MANKKKVEAPPPKCAVKDCENEVRGRGASYGLCAGCWDRINMENEHNDGGHRAPEGKPTADCHLCRAEATVDERKRVRAIEYLTQELNGWKRHLDRFEQNLYHTDEKTGEKRRTFRWAISHNAEMVLLADLMYANIKGLVAYMEKRESDLLTLTYLTSIRNRELQSVILSDNYRHNSTCAISNLDNLARFQTSQEMVRLLTGILVAYGFEERDNRIIGWSTSIPDFS